MKVNGAEWVAIGVITIVTYAVIRPVFKSGEWPTASALRCQSNMKRLGAAMAMYETDHNGFVCQAAWINALHPYVKEWTFFSCPSLRPPAVSGYALNSLVVGRNVSTINFIMRHVI